ncbi:nucleotidyl transferase AbiEii/AbiGii toxin family protein [Gelidibacter salicanalis]|uniref:Nucleotidyl transferase AbiEii/AbiGii toxin family protein n=1 Tax=Gelidibacter salicanalis TaxID=291193 RepID=A0A934NK91_9FLAO|nr:nucleotidyl transferase AbiEii/AbiGii toxin family protein [Gelidibacter salicanalis]MBJ7882959.1 nucleotidyl transferase AbiEii/AbiGii toxin family protein [Gelidibacter salicanalis]
MKLHQDKKLFRQAVQFTSDKMQIPAIYVEKDYWVTYALFNIFNDKIGSDTVFKGGTALSKCFGIIQRFSEDIDLVVLRREGESNNKLTNKIKAISKVVSAVLPEIDIPGLTQKMGMNRKTAHSYSKEFQGDYGQVRDAIVVEATWLGYFEPYTTKSLCSFVGQMMIDNQQIEIANENNLLPFDVLVLEPIRTICEKIMSLVRFSYSENPIEALRNKIRHVYDLNQLLLEKELLNFFNTKEFDDMLLKVAQDDVLSFKNNNKWLKNHPSSSLIFDEPKKVWSDLKPTYETDFKNLVYGNFPEEKELLKTLEMIKKRLLSIDWKIKIDDE